MDFYKWESGTRRNSKLWDLKVFQVHRFYSSFSGELMVCSTAWLPALPMCGYHSQHHQQGCSRVLVLPSAVHDCSTSARLLHPPEPWGMGYAWLSSQAPCNWWSERSQSMLIQPGQELQSFAVIVLNLLWVYFHFFHYVVLITHFWHSFMFQSPGFRCRLDTVPFGVNFWNEPWFTDESRYF